MSLIHEALQRVECAPEGARQPRGAAPAAPAGKSRRVLIVGGLMAAGLALPLAMSMSLSLSDTGASSDARSEISLQRELLLPTLDTPPHEPLNGAAETAQIHQVEIPGAPSSPPAVEPVPVAAVLTADVAATDSVDPSPADDDSPPAAEAPVDEPETLSPAGQVHASPGSRSTLARALHADLLAAIDRQAWPEAEAVLDELQSALPAEHLTRLRAEGWFYLQRGEYRSAVAAYREVLHRIPSDEQALVNLIHLHLALDERALARRLVEQALREEVDSAAIVALSRSLER